MALWLLYCSCPLLPLCCSWPPEYLSWPILGNPDIDLKYLIIKTLTGAALNLFFIFCYFRWKKSLNIISSYRKHFLFPKIKTLLNYTTFIRMPERHRQHLRPVHIQRWGVQWLRATHLRMVWKSMVPDSQPDRFVQWLFDLCALRGGKVRAARHDQLQASGWGWGWASYYKWRFE